MAGQYSVYLGGSSLGLMQGDAGVPTIITRAMGREISNTDGYGDTLLGGIFRGCRARAQMRCQEYKAATILAAWPWGTDGTIGVIGRDIYDIASSLVLTAIAGTPAASYASPASLTITKAIIPFDFDVSIAFGPILREVPLEFNALGVPSGSSSQTAQATGVLYSKT